MKKSIRLHFIYIAIICFVTCIACYQRLEIVGLHDQLEMQTNRADLFKGAYQMKSNQLNKIQK